MGMVPDFPEFLQCTIIYILHFSNSLSS